MLAYRLPGDYIEATNELIYLEYLILILYLGLEVLSFLSTVPPLVLFLIKELASIHHQDKRIDL